MKQLLTLSLLLLPLVGGAQERTPFQSTELLDHNPVVRHYHADPEILYAHKTNRYYLYSTTDGYEGWSGSYFKVFSSDNLKQWTDHGVMLNLSGDVTWAERNAWAPCIIERKEESGYRYYFYFTAQGKIGVAVSDRPDGGFKDSGRPIIDHFPSGVAEGQNIDPDVFHDPQSGNYYLYWGNGFLAVGQLTPDMLSLIPSTIRVITPSDGTFREGAYMVYREGKYYMMWSEDDTRSENYRVRYGLMSSPDSPIEIPNNNLILSKIPEKGIYGTGHNSAICLPETDDWYMVYHSFKRPEGITMGERAGYHRQVCIDRMYFDKQGFILPVVPTIEGVEPIIKKSHE